MFFDKLWVRIKGELLAFREDFAGAQEIREKAERLLHRLERQMETLKGGKQGPGTGDSSSGKSSEKEIQASLHDIEREWDELLKLRQEQKRKSENSEPETTPPNPRTLG